MTEAKPLTGVWDQWCVMSSRPYVKVITTEAGDEIEQTSLLDQNVCRQIVRNFGLSKDDLPCTLGHQLTTPEKAQYKTATYSALAVWHQGQVVEFAAHEAIERPTEADLPRADNGQRPEDGIYAYRKTVTELGAAIVTKKAVGKTSPEFVMDGRNQQNEPIGPQAVGLAWTDVPFLNGCEINLERFPQMRKFQRKQGLSRPEVGTMLKHEAEAGVEEKDSPEMKFTKLKTHFGRKAMMEAGVQDSDSPDVALGKFAKHMECHEAEGEAARKMEAEDKENADADKDKHGMEGPTVHAGAPTMVDPGKPSEKLVGGHAMESGEETKQAMSHAIQHQRAEMEQLKAKVAKFEADRSLAEAHKAIDSAWALGRLVPLHSGETEAQTKARFLKKYQTSKQLFEADLAPAGTHAVAGSLTNMRLTSNGLPLNFERNGSSMDIGNGRPDEELIARADELKAKNKNLTNEQAIRRVCMENPALGSAYAVQAKRASAGLL